MKHSFALLLVCTLALLPGQAQTAGSASDAAAPASEVDVQTAKKKARAEEQARDDKIKNLEKSVAWEPANKQNRLALVDFLESLASDSEKKDDWAGAWRYYQRAAAVLRDPAEPDWEARAVADSAKAADYRVKQNDKRVREEEARALARRVRDMPSIVAPSLDFNTKKQADDFAENRYREVVWKKVQSAWINSSARQDVKDTSTFTKPAIVSFDVHSDGEVSDIKITGTSGDRRIDLAAQKVVEDLGKMAPLLPGMGSLVRFQTEFGKVP